MSRQPVLLYFGELWDMPFLDDKLALLRQAPTPLGQLCLYCTEPIADGDRGLLQPVIGAGGSAQIQPVHAECNLRSVVGSPQHLRQQCNCFRPGLPETDGRSWREQARETVTVINAERAKAGHGPLW